MATLLQSDFEENNLSEWTSSSGAVAADAAAALHGSYGLKVTYSTTAAYVQHTVNGNDTRYRIRFYIDPNSLSMGSGDIFTILAAIDTAISFIWHIKLRYDGSNYQLFVQERTDAGDWSKISSFYTITDAPHCVEIDWKASSAPGANDGTFELIIDGVSKETITTIDNDTENVDIIRFGAIYDMDVTTSGIFYLDDYESNDDGSAIGEISEGNEYDLSASDGVEVSDSPSIIIGKPVSASDGVKVSDNPSMLLDRALSISDIAAMSDIPSLIIDFAMSVSDGIKVSDSPSFSLPGDIVPITARHMRPLIIKIRDKV